MDIHLGIGNILDSIDFELNGGEDYYAEHKDILHGGRRMMLSKEWVEKIR
jgi:hypothetical protein